MKRCIESAAVGATMLVALAFVSCGGGARSADERSLYVATTGDADDGVSIAVLVDGDDVTAYACPAHPERDRYAGWFSGRATSDARLQLVHDGSSLTASWNTDAAAGTLVDPDGNVVTWSGRRVAADGLTGLYFAFGSGCATGVIVIERGASLPPLVRGAWCDAQGRTFQVIPVMPVELVAGRLSVDVALPDGPRRLEVEPLRTSAMVR